MAIEVGLAVDVVRRAVACQSGTLEYAVPSIDQDAVDVAVSAGFLDVIGNGVARVTAAGRELVAKYQENK